jgi:tyrosinase
MARIRLDIAGLTLGDPAKAETQEWHPVLDTYARGVALMRDLDDDDPRSWTWAANTHGIAPGTPTRPTWAQCAHGSVFFLPWHRAYLAWFEQTIRDLTGVDDWAVPYWDYSLPGDVSDRSLPVEFGVETRVVGGKVVENPLFSGGRNDSAIPTQDIDIVGALSERRFVRSFQRGFGGVDPDVANGLVEMEPHNFVHVDIGGLMESPSTAGRDPIFWLHHANIDRLWEVWRGLAGSIALTDPGAASTLLVTQWRSAIFVFGDPGSPSTYAMDDIEDPDALGYSYESIDLPDDLATAIEQNRGVTALARGADAVDETEPGWEPVAAAFDVPSGEDRDIPIAGGAGAFAAARLDRSPSGLLIELGGVRATDPHAVYVVDVRSGPRGEAHRAGRFSTFGLAGTPETEERNYLIDASSILPDLVAEGWSGDQLSIAVVPESGRPDSGNAAKGIRIRQVTIYAPTA